MAAISGKSGSITFSGITVEVKSWTLDNAVDMLDSTSFSDAGIERNVAGIFRWSATCVANYDDTNTADVGDEATLTLTTTGAENWDGNAILSAMPVTTDTQGLVETTFTFTGNGALTPPS